MKKSEKLQEKKARRDDHMNVVRIGTKYWPYQFPDLLCLGASPIFTLIGQRDKMRRRY
jgi:hypothetical protein